MLCTPTVQPGCCEGGKAMWYTGVPLIDVMWRIQIQRYRCMWCIVQSLSGCFSPLTQMCIIIGLPLIGYDLRVQLSPMISSPELRLLHLNHILQDLVADPASLPRHNALCIIATVICNECYYITYFVGLGRTTIVELFFQNVKFITNHPWHTGGHSP